MAGSSADGIVHIASPDSRTLPTMPHPSGRPWIVAHQGASRRAAPNTIDAFALAVDLGADAIELDARRTADGVVIVHHDAWLPGQDRPIVAMTRREVATLAPSVPDLAAALDACRPLWVDVEIKNDPSEPDWDPDDPVLEAITPLVSEGTLVTSFNPVTVDRARRRGMVTGWLLSAMVPPADVLRDWPGHPWILPESTAMADAATVVAAAREAGAAVGVWTVDEPAEVMRLAAAGVDLVFTNEPDSALALFA